MHTLNGAGLMIGPLLLRALSASIDWVAFPILLSILMLSLAAVAATAHFGDSAVDKVQSNASEAAPLTSPAFWILAAIAVVYALAEGSFSNWAVVYLQEGKHLSATTASLGLSTFWGALVLGRLLISILVLKLPANLIWRSLPLLMAVAFALLPGADSPTAGIIAFALAGLGCSAFFPLTVSLATARFPQHLPWVSAMMIAALMCGTGLGSFLLGALHSWLPFEQLYRLSIAYPVTALLLTFAMPREVKSEFARD
jgi:fucose permease